MNKSKVRKHNAAPRFYPEQKEELEEKIETLLTFSKSVDLERKPQIAIAPHDPYKYSGKTAAQLYKVLEGISYELVILLAPAHFHHLPYPVTASFDQWITPLGKIDVEKEVNRVLNLKEDDSPFIAEHSIEVQLPFIQWSLKTPRIFPIHINEYSPDFSKKLLNLIEKNYWDTLILISSNLSHYFPEEEAVHIDKHSIKTVLEKDLSQASFIDACGQAAIETGIYLSFNLNLEAKLLFYDTSASAYGETSEVVGYTSIVFF